MNTPDTAERCTGARMWHTVLQSTAMLLLYMVPQMPRQGVWFPFLLGLISLFFFLYVERNLRSSLEGYEQRWFTAALFGFCGYLFLNSLWSQLPMVALGKAAFVLCMVLLTPFVARAFARQPRTTMERTAFCALIGAVIGSMITAIEFSTDHLIGRTLYSAFPDIRPGDKTLDVFIKENGQLLPESEFRSFDGDVIVRIASSALNRIHSLRLLLLWPILFLALYYSRTKIGAVLATFLAFTALYTVFAGESQTAQLALVLSAVTFLAALYWVNAVHWALLGAWCVAVVLAIPLSIAPYAMGLQKAKWISPSFRDRMIIWEFTGNLAMKSPILGIGVRSTRVLNKELKNQQTQLPGYVVPKRLGLHTHNNFLQVWFELGAIGAAFMLAIGIGLLQSIRRLLPTVRPYAYATFVAACIVAAFGWGLWQTWLLAGYTLATMMVAFINSYARAVQPRPSPAKN